MAYYERINYHAGQLEGSNGPYDMFHQLSRSDQDWLIRTWIYHARMYQKYHDALPIPFCYVEPIRRSRNDCHGWDLGSDSIPSFFAVVPTG